jgi:hypothetical protein
MTDDLIIEGLFNDCEWSFYLASVSELSEQSFYCSQIRTNSLKWNAWDDRFGSTFAP